MRNNALAAAALTAALACACRRSEEPARTEAPVPALSAPERMVTNPLSKETTGYTNEMQAHYIQNQAAALGIQRIAPTDQSGADSAVPPPAITYAQGLEETRELSRALANQRRAIDRNKPKSVDLPGNTPRLLQTPADGGENGAPSAPAPSAPQGPQ